MPDINRTSSITETIEQKYKQQQLAIDFAKEKIVILDEAREPYISAITSIDGQLNSETDAVNVTLDTVEEKYQDRIDSGCRTNLFWAQIGIDTLGVGGTDYTYQCYAVSYVGYDTSQHPVSLASSAFGEPIPDEYGFIRDNRHGLKQRTEPYSQDLISTYIGSGIGSIAVGTKQLHILAPLGINGIVGLQAGQLVQASKKLVFAGDVNRVASISTVTNQDLSNLPELGIGTDVSINVVTLEDQAIGNAKAPEEDGSYVSFTFLQNPDNLPADFGIAPRDVGLDEDVPPGPYVPQQVSIMDSTTLGSATKIEYDNSGKPKAAQQWNQFMEGLPDPDSDDPDDTVEEPNVGAGVNNYLVGFTSAPAVSTVPATEGQQVTTKIPIDNPSSIVGYIVLPTCSSAVETAITDAETARDTKESEFSSGISTFNDKLNLANALREDLNELNLRIYGYRLQIGRAQANQIKYSNLSSLINQPENKEIIDNA